MKRIALTIIMLCVWMAVTAQPDVVPPTAAREYLRGPVKMVMTTMIFNNEQGDACISSATTNLYDRSGRLTTSVDMSEDGIDGGVIYRHDGQGRLASTRWWGGDSRREERYVYASDGRMLRIETTYHDGSRWSHIVTAYDASGRPLAMKDTASGFLYSFSYKPDGSLRTSTLTIFDKATVTYYGQYGVDSVVSQNEKTFYQYNDKGELTQERSLNSVVPGEKRFTYDQHFYDDHGNWTWRKITFPDGTEAAEDREIIYYED